MAPMLRQRGAQKQRDANHHMGHRLVQSVQGRIRFQNGASEGVSLRRHLFAGMTRTCTLYPDRDARAEVEGICE